MLRSASAAGGRPHSLSRRWYLANSSRPWPVLPPQIGPIIQAFAHKSSPILRVVARLLLSIMILGWARYFDLSYFLGKCVIRTYYYRDKCKSIYFDSRHSTNSFEFKNVCVIFKHCSYVVVCLYYMGILQEISFFVETVYCLNLSAVHCF